MVNGIKHHLHTSSVSHQKTSIKQQRKIDTVYCWVLSLIFFSNFWLTEGFSNLGGFNNLGFLCSLCLRSIWLLGFTFLASWPLMPCSLWALRTSGSCILPALAVVVFFFFLPVSYFSLSLLWLSFFYARSANVIFQKMFSPEIALNVQCETQQSQNWPISSYLSILNYLYPSRRIW